MPVFFSTIRWFPFTVECLPISIAKNSPGTNPCCFRSPFIQPMFLASLDKG